MLDEFTRDPLDYDSIVKITNRRLVLACKDGPIVPFTYSKGLAERIRAEFYQVEKCGHFLGVEGGDPERAIELLDLHQLRDKKFSDLSQGQKKRAAIAKVFLKERDPYLLDEPTANLDPLASKEIRDIILKLSKDKMILYSSHNLYKATDIGTYLILIKNGSVSMLDRISNIQRKNYRVGIKTTADITTRSPRRR